MGLLLSKKKAEALVTPIFGIVGDCNEAGVICQISKIDTLIVQIPVTEEYLHQLKSGQKVEIILPHSHYEQLEDGIVCVGNQAYFINGQNMFFVYCKLANTNNILFNGSTGYARIHYGESSLYKQMTSHWNNYKYRKLAFLK